jgi:hypothetical protein
MSARCWQSPKEKDPKIQKPNWFENWSTKNPQKSQYYGNETADDAAKEALNEEIHHTERNPEKKWKNSTITMKERKPHHKMNTNTKTMTRAGRH